MRLASPPPWHLIACALLPILALILVNLMPDSVQASGAILGLALVILVPGYLLALALFPGNSDLAMSRRALLCLGFSGGLAILASLILTFTPRGLEPASLATILSLLSLFLAAVAYARWSALPRRKRFDIAADRGFRSTGTVSRPLRFKARTRTKNRVAYLAVALVVVSAAAALAYAINMQKGPSAAPGFTEFHVSLPGGEDGSDNASLQAKTALTALAEIVNHEGRAINYTLRLASDDAVLFSKNLELGQNESWKGPISCILDKPASSLKLDFLLFKENDLAKPYLEDHLWVDVVENESRNTSALGDVNYSAISSGQSPVSNSSVANASGKTAPVTMEQSSKVSVSSATKASTQKSSTSSSSVAKSKSSKSSSAAETAKSGSSQVTASSAAASSPASSIEASSSTAASLSSQTPSSVTASSSAIESHETVSSPSVETPSSNQSSQAILSPPSSTSSTSVVPLSTNKSSAPANSSASSASSPSALSSVSNSSRAVATAARSDEANASKEQSGASGENNDTAKGDLNSNRSPTLKDLHPDKSSPQIPGAVILWTANATDPEYDPVQYKFLLNGEPATVWSKFNYWSWNTKGLTIGDYKITVLARDGKHALENSFDSSMNATFTLAAPNSAPVLQSLSATPASPQSKGTSITWLASAADPDNDQISYRFFLNDKEATGWSSSNSWTWDTSSADPGDYKISVIAKDGKHATGDGFDSSKASAFRLLPPAPSPPPNRAPILQGLKPSPASPQSSGTSITWTANATDPDNDQISYRFLLDGKEVTDWSGSNSWTWNTEAVAPGSYEVEARIRDDKHASGDSFDDAGNATLTLLPPNRPPVLESLAPDKASPQNRGTTVFWKAKASDPEDDRVLYKFLLGGQPVSKWTKSNSWSWSTGDAPTGDYEIRVLIRDEKHADESSFDGSMNASFTLSSPNQAPALQELKADKTSPQSKGTGVTWTAKASDADGDPISYRFLLDDKDMTGWSTSGSWTWDTSSAAPGDHNIKAVVRDGKHAAEDSYDSSMTAGFTLAATNQIPVLQALSSDPASPQGTGTSISWTAKASDADGDPMSYKFLLDDKDMTGWSTSGSWTWDTSSAAPGDHNIKAVVRDGKHASEESYDGSKEAVFTLQASNQLPTLLSLQPDKSSPQTQGATISWKAEATDPEGDPIQYRFLQDGKAMTGWSESNSWSWATAGIPKEKYQIQVQIRDGKHAPESSFDRSMEQSFTLISEIDQQIEQLQKKRGSQAFGKGSGQSLETQVVTDNSTKERAVLGKGVPEQDTAKKPEPRRLG